MSRERKPILYSLGSKFLITSIVILVIVMLVATSFAISVIRKNIRREMEGHLKSDSSISQLIFKNRLRELENLASLTTGDNTVKVTLELGIIPQLEEHLKKTVSRNKLDFFTITNERGLSISYSPAISTNPSFLQEQIAEALHGKSTVGISLGNYNSAPKESSFSAPTTHLGKEIMMVAVAPIWVRKQIAGALSLGRLVTNDTEIINLMKKTIKADIIIWQIGKGVAASSLPTDGLAKFSTSLNQLLDKKKPNKEEIYIADILIDDKNFIIAVCPVGDLQDKTVASIIVCKSIEALKEVERQTIKNMIMLSLSGVFVAIFFITLITRAVSKPIEKTVEAMEAVTKRDDLTQHVDVNAKGEVGKLVFAFNDMVATIRESRAKLQELANTLDQKVEDRTRELKETQKELVNKAMEAGRAQLSAMILHNIGNAVTPVRVRLEKIKSDELKQVADYLETCYLDLTGHADGLQRYVNDDPRGKEIFSYMGSLIDSLKEHDEKRASATNKIEDAVSYISDILSMQQVYAATEQEIKELTSLNRLIEHGIEMQSSSLEKRGIVLKQNLEPNLPKLLVDKSRLMQVLINLIKNSCEAIDALRDDDREKVIAVKSFAAGGHVGFEITDSGIGIEPDRLDTIFKFGASSKGASGFGLYYSKLFVEANGGKINIISSGRGKETTVSITLPAAKPFSAAI